MSNRAEFDPLVARALDASDTTRISFLQAISGKLLSAGYHYNTNTLDWEANTGGTAAGADVNVTNFPATQPVTGAFYQATQPVSLAAMPTTPVTGTFWQTTQPVSGTFFQSTQPVSIAATVAVSAASLPLPTGAATDAAFVAANGSATDKPAAYTLLDRLYQLGVKLDNQNRVMASEATQLKVLAALNKIAPPPTRPTLLHGR